MTCSRIKPFSGRMLISDENISEIEVWRLHEWGIDVRQVGLDIAATGTSDENVIPVLHRLKRPTFFTRDRDFWNPKLLHARYCSFSWTSSNMKGRLPQRSAAFYAIPHSTPTPSGSACKQSSRPQ